MRQILFALISILFVSGCATVGQPEQIAVSGGFRKFYISAKQFDLAVFGRYRKQSDAVRIYIEGDGYAWCQRSLPSSDPTPMNPLVISLAVKDKSQNVFYLARPGQYPDNGVAVCGDEYWTAKRFSREVVESMDDAVTQIKNLSGANKVELIGYSGGAAIAVLIAARRTDVATLRTIAGNLDHSAVNEFHNVSQLSSSLKAIDYAAKISNIPQRHFAASGDQVIPLSVLKSFARQIGDVDFQSITVVEGATHDSGWVSHWQELLNIPLFNRG